MITYIQVRVRYSHSTNILNIILNPLLLSHTSDILEENEAVSSFHVHSVQCDGTSGISLSNAWWTVKRREDGEQGV
jgi:hypothetical protein